MAGHKTGNGHPAERLYAVAGQFAKTGMRSSEMGVAAAQTIGYRTAMMAAAMGNPVDLANPEFVLMGSEKVEASVEAFHAVATGIGEFSTAWMSMLAKQAEAATVMFGGFSACRSPSDLADIQCRVLAELIDAGIHAGLRLVEASAALTAAGMRPAYRKVRANARRLASEQA